MCTSFCTLLSCCTHRLMHTEQHRSTEEHSSIPVGHTRTPSFISYWSRNIFITLSGVSGQAESMERREEGERGHVEPERDTGMTLWHVEIPSTELCLAQQHETRKWTTNIFPDPLLSPFQLLTHTPRQHTFPFVCKKICVNMNQYFSWHNKRFMFSR